MNTTRPKAAPSSQKSHCAIEWAGKRLQILLCCWVLGGFLFFAPAPTLAASLSITDSLGRTVEIPQPVHRIVALNSDILEVLRTLKAQDLVVGVFSEIVREPEFWGDLVQKPKAGSWRDPDLEAIVRLAPDLVIAYSRNPGPELEKKGEALGFRVLRLDLYRIEVLEKEVRALGLLLGKETEADRFCRWHRQHLDAVRSKLDAVADPPSVYVESYSDYHAAGPGSGGHEMCLVSGGRCVAGDLSIPYAVVTSEWVISRNPDVIVKAASFGNGYAVNNAGPFNRRRNAIMNRPAWNHVAAVESGRVYVMDSAIWTGPRAIVGIVYMARWIHPGRFPDLHPGDLHREYLEIFQGIPYKGVFVSDDIAGKAP
ncbi:ABC transporter substrate-binding protein [Desulforhabdus amnigena]|uniref:ABC transporter substrate-binding protein n=1 Tax=Desulforhabdus amnigena TaxID=40218 RepID=UPI0016919B87|nr:ABC transporter substrate-binding protein [Desulforhabdus amnigena]NLJ28126.1 ABC transporter substrate-binding protein [Deltaproteobacteria bacterium]